MADVLIVGGSVAGSALAIHLARRGKRVRLVEAARFPRDKPCGEGVLPPGVRELETLGVFNELRARGRPFRGIRYRTAGGLTAQTELPDGPGLAIRRVVIDEVLFRRAAREPGVEAVEGEAVPELPRDVPLVVLACGPGPASKLVPLPGRRPRRPRFGTRVHLAGADFDPEWVEVFLTPAGEVYTSPSGPDYHLVAILQNDRADPDAALAALGGRVARARPVSERLTAGPLGWQAERPFGDGWLAVGDAAAQVDPLTGEGMSAALVSARIAAEELDRCRDFSARSLGNVAAALRRACDGALRISALALRLVSDPRRAQRAVARLSRRPELFAALLDVLCGRRPFDSLPLWSRVLFFWA